MVGDYRLHILRQVGPIPGLVDVASDTVADPSVGPEQHAVEIDTAQALRNLVAELLPRRRTLVRMLLTDHPRSYAEVAQTAGIPPGGIAPTRARALRRLRDHLAAAEAAVAVTLGDSSVTEDDRPPADSGWTTGS